LAIDKILGFVLPIFIHERIKAFSPSVVDKKAASGSKWTAKAICKAMIQETMELQKRKLVESNDL